MKGQIKATFAIKASPDYKTRLAEFAEFLNGEMADVARDALRLLAEDDEERVGRIGTGPRPAGWSFHPWRTDR